jgi:pyridoxal phosphate enzyme (YggS family)
MNILNHYKNIKKNIESCSSNISINLIVVTKGRSLSDIEKIINAGHIHFGENRVQESINKWKDILTLNTNIKLHFIGKLQTNKVADVIAHFSYMHSLDNDKLALKMSSEEKKLNKNLHYFVQVNLGEENQKSGILKKDLSRFISYCQNDLKLNIIGLMCLPPINEDSDKYFKELKQLAFDNNLKELSMGMSNDYVAAIKNGSTFVRVGSGIFEEKFN